MSGSKKESQQTEKSSQVTAWNLLPLRGMTFNEWQKRGEEAGIGSDDFRKQVRTLWEEGKIDRQGDDLFLPHASALPALDYLMPYGELTHVWLGRAIAAGIAEADFHAQREGMVMERRVIVTVDTPWRTHAQQRGEEGADGWRFDWNNYGPRS